MGNIVGHLAPGGYFYPFVDQQNHAFNHERLIAAIKARKSNEVLDLMNCPAWQDIFRRQKYDTQSPVQLLLKYMPKEAEQLQHKCEEQLQQKCEKEGCFKYVIELLTELRVQQYHEQLIAAIKAQQSKVVLDFMNYRGWQDIFRRQKSDTQSPVQLLLIHMPKEYEQLRHKCRKEGCIKYLTELLNDYS
uniref:Uncharacterized protein n=1 Tax=Panagrolaimus davidi TaxID=227884 RepID=A0A914P7I5_9BILA